MSDALEEFRQHGISASFHFASEGTDEWRLGYPEQDKALKIFDENPELQDDMREIAKNFLWSLSNYR